MKQSALLLLITLLLASPAINAQTSPVPKGYRLESPADYKRYEQDVLKCIEWYDNSHIRRNNAVRQEVQKFLVAWHEGSPNVTIAFGNLGLQELNNNPTLIVTYMNGWSKYVLQTGDNKNKSAALHATLNHLLDTYANPKNGFEPSKHLDKLLKAREKGELQALAEKEARKFK